MKLIDIVETFISGDWGSETCTDEEGVKVHCLRSADIVPIYQFDYDNIPCRYVSQRSHDSRELQEGDIVIEKSGGTNNCSTGRPIYVSNELLENNKPLLCSNFCEAFRVKKGWSSRYIYYYIKLVHKSNIFFNFEGKTSGIHNLDIDSAFKAIEIPDISYKQQVKIATTIQNIECKISQNRKLNSVLENMAKQLYDYWFVQFDFPNEEGKPYKSSGGKMVYNKTLKREIPKGWGDGKLIDIANITMGQSPDGSSYNKDGDGVIFYQGSTDFGIRFPEVRQYSTAPTRFANKGDILMSVRAPVGAINFANNDCCIGRGLCAMNSKIGSVTHLYHTICVFKEKFERASQIGTTFGSITKDELYSLPVVIPHESIVSKYERLCSPIFDRQMGLGVESVHLTSLRDYLIPLLMNGQVTIKEDNQI